MAVRNELALLALMFFCCLYPGALAPGSPRSNAVTSGGLAVDAAPLAAKHKPRKLSQVAACKFTSGSCLKNYTSNGSLETMSCIRDAVAIAFFHTLERFRSQNRASTGAERLKSATTALPRAAISRSQMSAATRARFRSWECEASPIAFRINGVLTQKATRGQRTHSKSPATAGRKRTTGEFATSSPTASNGYHELPRLSFRVEVEESLRYLFPILPLGHFAYDSATWPLLLRLSRP
jgi:hypothetical protein